MTREEDIRNAVECMRKGGVILYPTDTVWGIGCDATNKEAVAKVYAIKKRDDSKALICLVHVMHESVCNRMVGMSFGRVNCDFSLLINKK